MRYAVARNFLRDFLIQWACVVRSEIALDLACMVACDKYRIHRRSKVTLQLE